MNVAIDLDHTLLNYSSVYNTVLKDLEIDNLFKKNEVLTKNLIKNTIKKNPDLGNEVWIKFQGLCYGKYIEKVLFFDNSIDTISTLIKNGISVTIVSHKTKTSLCKNYSLQELATKRIQKENLNVKIVYKSSLEDKINYLNNNNFSFIIDDLEKVLEQISNRITKIHFGKSKSYFSTESWKILNSFFVAYIESEKPKLTHIQKNIFKTNSEAYFKIFNSEDRFIRESEHLKALSNYNYVPQISNIWMNIILTKEVLASPVFTLEQSFQLEFQKIITHLRKSSIQHKTTHNVSCYFQYIHRIKVRANQIKNDTIKIQVNNFLNEWTAHNKDKELGYDYCLPDLSKSNMLKNHSNYFFFDFESAGYGSPERAFLNFIHHPKNNLTIEEVDILLRTFEETYTTNFTLESALNIFEINYLEWCIIIYNYNSEIGYSKLSEFFLNFEDDTNFLRKTKEYEFLARKISTN